MTGGEYKALRIAAKLNQKELAGLLGTTNAQISYRENNKRQITKEAAIAIKALADKMSV